MKPIKKNHIKQKKPNYSCQNWEFGELGKLFSFTGGLGISREQLGNRGIPYLHYGDMHKDNFSYVSYDNYVALPKYDIKINGDESFLLKDGDVVFLDASEDLTGTSRCVVVDNPDNKPFIAGLHTFIARPLNNSLSKWYKKYFTQTQMVQKQFEHLAVGIKVYTVNRNDIKKIIVSFPKSIKEQQKIAKILTKWDDAIELQKQLIENLELQKKSLIQHVFQKNTDKFMFWGDICTIAKGTQINNDQLLENGKYYMLNGGIVPSGFLNKWNTPADTISISEGGESCGFVQFNKQKFWSGGHLYTLQKIKDGIYNKYLYAYLKHNEKKIMALRVGSGLPNIQLASLNKFRINIVNYKKQEYIGNLFFDMEEQISLHSQKLDLLTCQRKALMQRLLTGAIRVKV